MDIQTRKSAFVQEFLKIQSEELISRFEKLLHSNAAEAKKFTLNEFNTRIDASLKDSEKDFGSTSEEFLSEIKQWQ